MCFKKNDIEKKEFIDLCFCLIGLWALQSKIINLLMQSFFLKINKIVTDSLAYKNTF